MNSSILKLSSSQTVYFRTKTLPRLLDIVEREAKDNSFNTLCDLVQLLLLFDEV